VSKRLFLFLVKHRDYCLLESLETIESSVEFLLYLVRRADNESPMLCCKKMILTNNFI